MRKKRILPHIAALAAALCMAWLPHVSGAVPDLTVKAGAETQINGIGVSKERVRRGEAFEIIINAPAVNARIETVEIRFEFDTSVLELTSWSPRIGSGSSMVNFDNSTGFAVIAAANTNLDLSSGLTLTAKARAKTDAPIGTHNIRLASWDLIRSDTGENWTPATKTAQIKVSDKTISISGKISLKAPDVFNEIAAVKLTDSSGNAAETTVTLKKNSRTGLFEGTYQFSEAECNETYTLQIVIPGCQTRTETVKPNDQTVMPDLDVHIFGDIDGDGRAGATDATQILKYLVGKPTAIKGEDGALNEYLLSVAKVEGGRTLTSRDATQILRYVAEFSSVFDNIKTFKDK